MYFPWLVYRNKWLRLPRKCLPWQQFHVIALAKLQGAKNSFTGSVGAHCILPRVAPAWFADIIFQVKAILGQQLPLRNIGTTRRSLTPEWRCCFRLCMCVSVWWARTDLQSPSPATPAGAATFVCARGTTSTLWRASLQNLLCPEAAWFDSGAITAGKPLLDGRSRTLANIISISWFRVTEFTVSCAWTRIDLEDVTMSVWPCRWLQSAVCYLSVTALLSITRMEEGHYRILPLRNFLGDGLQCSIQ